MRRGLEKVMNKPILLTILLLTMLVRANLRAQDPFEKLERDWQSQQQKIETKWLRDRQQLENEWNAFEKAQQEQWDRFAVAVERKWQAFVHSTKKDWVDYSPDLEARSKVDFENGTVTVETVVSDEDPQATEKARQKIEQQAERMFAKEDLTDKKVLEDLITTKEGKKVTKENFKQFFRDELVTQITPEPETFQTTDGTKRKRYSVRLSLVPDHIRIRAEKYLPAVQINADRFKLKPQLVLAIMHTESYFNPYAESSCNAIGIMQIIPRHAGREAYRAVYGVDNLISREYLFDPHKNIELGCAYLSLLKYQHFKDVQGEMKNRYVSICGYNWGPTAVRRNIVAKYELSKMNDRDVYSLLREKTPLETSDYIKRVTERMPAYDPFFQRG